MADMQMPALYDYPFIFILQARCQQAVVASSHCNRVRRSCSLWKVMSALRCRRL